MATVFIAQVLIARQNPVTPHGSRDTVSCLQVGPNHTHPTGLNDRQLFSFNSTVNHNSDLSGNAVASLVTDQVKPMDRQTTGNSGS